jgi:hypothetical protein
MNLEHGQRFEIDARFAVVEFSTASSVRLSVSEQRLVFVDAGTFRPLRTNPHIGWIDLHFPTDGGRPSFANMELAPEFCTRDYAQSLYLTLAEFICIPKDTPYELHIRPKATEGFGVLGGESRFLEISGYHNKDSFEQPEGFAECLEKHKANNAE